MSDFLEGSAIKPGHTTEGLASLQMAGFTRSWTALTAICLTLWLAVRCIYFVGFEGSDDMFYVRFANLWHRTPANQWEVRLLADALIGLSMRVFGYHEWSAALPSMLGSLAVMATTLLGCRLFGSIRHAWWAGLLVALLPLEVGSATNVSAHTVMVGLMAVGTLAFIQAPASRRATITAAICLPLGVVAHWNGSYYLAIVLVAALLVNWRKYLKPAMYVCIGGVIFMAADMLTFKILFNDAFCRFRVCMPHHLEPETAGVGQSLDREMVFWSLQQLIAGKPFGIALCVVLIGAVTRYRQLSQPLRVLFWITVLFWTEMNFGSYVPWEYRPFWRNTRYLHLLVMPAAILFAAIMVEAQRRRFVKTVGVVSLIGCVIALNAGGTWGQSVRVSRELLVYVRQHPEKRFVTDVHTMNEIYVLNELKTPLNLAGTKDAGRSSFLDRSVRQILTPDVTNCDAILINPLNVERRPCFAALVQSHLGQVQYETTSQLSPLCRLVPPLANLSWAICKPPARVHAFAAANRSPAPPMAMMTR